MNAIGAILADSLREAVDRRAMIVLLGLALFPIVFCFGMSFESESLPQVLERHVDEVRSMQRPGISMYRSLEHEVIAIDPVAGESGWPPEVYGGLRLQVRFPNPAELDDVVDAWGKFRQESGRSVPDSGARGKAVTFLEERFRELGWDEVAVRADAADPTRFEVAVLSDSPATLAGAFRMGVMFGLADLPLHGTSVAEAVTLIQLGLGQVFVGFIGILIGLIVCASFVPNMLQKGTLDLALARPLRRSTLLLGKYAGGLFFLGSIAAFALGGCWLGLAVGSGYASPAFLAVIPGLLLSFAALHAVSVLVAVVTRSSGVAALVACGVWGVCSVVGDARLALSQPGMPLKAPEWFRSAVDTVWWVLPKISDIDAMSLSAVAAANGVDTDSRTLGDVMPVTSDPWIVVGSTLAFTAVILTLACMAFRKRDW